MKILHVCLAAFYIDNYSYQENILPRMHKLLGHGVRILASTETFVDDMNLGYTKPGEYYNEDGILVKRVAYSNILPRGIMKKLRIYKNFYKYIDEFKPDLIFLHDVQFLSIISIIKYKKENPSVKIVADGHADFSNSARTFVSKYVLHKGIYKAFIKLAEPYIDKFYGTLPARVDFFKNVYSISAAKVSFLPMGVDDILANKYNTLENKTLMRTKYNIKQEDFLIVTGGKIDLAKTQTLLLMKAVQSLKSNVKLLVFGSVAAELKDKFNKLCSEKIQYIGWANVEESYQYLSAADLVIFPGRHSVYWEQTAGLGKPMIVKLWKGTTHVDLGGNVRFLKKDSVEEIQRNIEFLLEHPEEYQKMKQVAVEKGMKEFSYMDIAKRSIED